MLPNSLKWEYGEDKIKNRSEIWELCVKKREKFRGLEKSLLVEIIYHIFVLISFIVHLFICKVEWFKEWIHSL